MRGVIDASARRGRPALVALAWLGAALVDLAAAETCSQRGKLDVLSSAGGARSAVNLAGSASSGRAASAVR